MTITIEERLTHIEADVNRILEILQNATTCEQASKYAVVADGEATSILDRIYRVEKLIQSLQHKWKEAYKRANS